MVRKPGKIDYSQYGALAELIRQSDKRQAIKNDRKRQREEAKAKAAVERVERGRLYEITSSGLTHTCGDGFITGLLCPLMLNTYTRHRQRGPNADDRDGYFIGRNFGQLQFDNKSLTVSVRALPSGEEVLNKVILPHRVSTSRDEAVLQIRARDFFRMYRDASLAVKIAFMQCCSMSYTSRLNGWHVQCLPLSVRARVRRLVR